MHELRTLSDDWRPENQNQPLRNLACLENLERILPRQRIIGNEDISLVITNTQYVLQQDIETVINSGNLLHLEWMLACFDKVIDILVCKFHDQRDVGGENYLVCITNIRDKIDAVMCNNTANTDVIAKQHNYVASFYQRVAGIFSMYSCFRFSIEYTYRSLFYFPRDGQNDSRYNSIDAVEQRYWTAVTRIANQIRTNWRVFYDQLYTLRDDLKIATMRCTTISDIRTQRTKFNMGLTSFLTEAASEIISRFSLGDLYQDFTLLGLGSISMGYATAYSDVDIALLFNDQPIRGRQSAPNKEHSSFQNFITLFDFLFDCIGEKYEAPPQFGWLIRKNGTAIDKADLAYIQGPEQSLRNDSNLRESQNFPMLNTPELMAEVWHPYRHKGEGIDTKQETSLVHTIPLFSSEIWRNSNRGLISDDVLYRRYQQCKDDLWLEEGIGRKTDYFLNMLQSDMDDLNRRLPSLRTWLLQDDNVENCINLKELILSPIVLWVSHLASFLRCQDSTDSLSIDGMFLLIKNSGYFNINFISTLEDSFNAFWFLKSWCELNGKFMMSARAPMVFHVNASVLNEVRQLPCGEMVYQKLMNAPELFTHLVKSVVQLEIFFTKGLLQEDHGTLFADEALETLFRKTVFKTTNIQKSFLSKRSDFLKYFILEGIDIRLAEDPLGFRFNGANEHDQRDKPLSFFTPIKDFLAARNADGTVLGWFAILNRKTIQNYYLQLFGEKIYNPSVPSPTLRALKLQSGQLVPCLFFENTDQRNVGFFQTRLPCSSLSNIAFTWALLRALMTDVFNPANFSLIYCYDEMLSSSALDLGVLRAFTNLSIDELLQQWKEEINAIEHVYKSIFFDVPNESGIKTIFTLDTAEEDACTNEIEERFDLIKVKIDSYISLERNNSYPLRAIDLLESVFYSAYKVLETVLAERGSISQRYERFINTPIRHYNNEIITIADTVANRARKLIGQPGSRLGENLSRKALLTILPGALISKNTDERHSAVEALEGLNKRFQYFILQAYWDGRRHIDSVDDSIIKYLARVCVIVGGDVELKGLLKQALLRQGLEVAINKVRKSTLENRSVKNIGTFFNDDNTDNDWKQIIKELTDSNSMESSLLSRFLQERRKYFVYAGGCDNHGNTLFHIAAQYGSLDVLNEVLTCLMTFDPDISMRVNYMGKIPIDYLSSKIKNSI